MTKVGKTVALERKRKIFFFDAFCLRSCPHLLETLKSESHHLVGLIDQRIDFRPEE